MVFLPTRLFRVNNLPIHIDSNILLNYTRLDYYQPSKIII